MMLSDQNNFASSTDNLPEQDRNSSLNDSPNSSNGVTSPSEPTNNADKHFGNNPPSRGNPITDKIYKKLLLFPNQKIETLEKAVSQLIKENNSHNASISSLNADRLIFLVVFGVFASLVAFFSVEFQLLRSISNIISFVGISTLLISSLLLFNLFFYVILTPKEEILLGYFRWLVGILGSLFIVGIGFSIWGNSVKSPEEELALKLKNELKVEFVNSIDSIKNQILSLELQMNSNQLKFQLIEQRIPDTTKSKK